MKRHLGSVAGLVAIFFFKLPNESEEKEQEESEDKLPFGLTFDHIY